VFFNKLEHFRYLPRTVEIDTSPARPLIVPLELYAAPQHGRDRPPVH
jgi:hypothetical protein